jgi:hypothetical protein
MKKVTFRIRVSVIGVIVMYWGYLFYCNYGLHKNNSFEPAPLHNRTKKEFTLFFCKNNQKNDSEKLSLFSESLAQDCFHLISQWLLRAWQRRIISSPIICQSVILDPLGTTVFVSFDFPLFNDSYPICTKIQIINGLLKTIQQVSASFQLVYLLVRHEPMIDKHIDWIRPFAISGYSVTSF